MNKLRPALAATTLALVAVHAGTAAGTAAAASGVSIVGDLAGQAADAVAQEYQLLDRALDDPGTGAPADLRATDDRGAELLAGLDRLDVELTPAIRTALGTLPSGDAGELEAGAPSSEVYETALADLLRIAAAPGAVTPTTESSGGPSTGLLIVAAAALVALGGAALANALRRRPDPDLAALAWSDGLTGLANRRRLDHDLARTAVASRQPTAVIMLDVDHFKAVNDAFGHRVGDEVLREIATMIGRHVRSDDVVYRYGGEEFCVLLPGATADQAARVAGRVVDAAREIRLPGGGHVTVSIGIADGRDDVTHTLETADQALLVAKERGRDQMVLADAPNGEPLTPV